MEVEPVDRHKLSDYLMGKLPAAEHDAIAEQCFVNDDLAVQLLELEDDLIDQYARGQFPEAECPRLENYLNHLPSGWHRVAVARAAVEMLAENRTAVTEQQQAVSAAAAPGAEAVGLWQMLAAWLVQPLPVLVMAAGFLTLGGLLLWLLLRDQQWRSNQQQLLAQMQQHTAQQEQSLREVKRQLAAEQTRLAQLQQELERAKQLRPLPVPAPALSWPVVSWLLSSTVTREPGRSSEPVRLNPQAKRVALIIPLQGKQQYLGYEVELKTEDGQQLLWKDSQPDSPPIRNGQQIVFYRPASEFRANQYKLTLTLISALETKTRDYYFTVVRP